jgi:TonB family protein
LAGIVRGALEATCAVCITLFLAPAATSQQPPSGGTCAPQGAELSVRQVFATLEPRAGQSPALEIFLGTLLQEISFAFQPPDSSAPLATYSFTLLLHKDGRLSDAKPVESYIPEGLAKATLRAIDSISRSGGIGPLSVEMPQDPLPLTMVFRLGARPGPTSVPFYQMSVPAFLEFETDKPAQHLVEKRAPRYPRELREMYIEGEVILQFVVDTAGRIDLRTVRLIGPPKVYREFVAAVVDFLPNMRFTPAERGGCKVRQLVQLPFTFKLDR